MLLMHVAFNGEIILPAPSWVSYEPQAQIAEEQSSLASDHQEITIGFQEQKI